MVPDAAAEAAAAETGRQVVAVGFALLVTPLVARRLMRIMREAADPDAERQESMARAKRMERMWARAAAECWKRAEAWRLAYEDERP